MQSYALTCIVLLGLIKNVCCMAVDVMCMHVIMEYKKSTACGRDGLEQQEFDVWPRRPGAAGRIATGLGGSGTCHARRDGKADVWLVRTRR
jgi:hypothetical protein